MVDAGTTGEYLVAYVRVLATGIILLVPIGNLILHPYSSEHRVGFVVAFVTAVAVVKLALDFIGRHGFAPFAWWRIAVGVLGLAALAIYG